MWVAPTLRLLNSALLSDKVGAVMNEEAAKVIFQSREVSDRWDPLTADDLEVGSVYFDLGYADNDLLFPVLETLVLVNISERDGLRVFLFQVATAYFSGILYNDVGDYDYPMLFEHDEKSLNSIFDFEKTLDQFLICSLRREGKE